MAVLQAFIGYSCHVLCFFLVDDEVCCEGSPVKHNASLSLEACCIANIL